MGVPYPGEIQFTNLFSSCFVSPLAACYCVCCFCCQLLTGILMRITLGVIVVVSFRAVAIGRHWQTVKLAAPRPSTRAGRWSNKPSIPLLFRDKNPSHTVCPGRGGAWRGPHFPRFMHQLAKLLFAIISEGLVWNILRYSERCRAVHRHRSGTCEQISQVDGVEGGGVKKKG